MRWYLPSFYGDIKLTKKDADNCQMEVTQLTVKEKQALERFQVSAAKKGWIATKCDPTRATEPVVICGPIHKVQASLARLLKPSRKLVAAVKFSDGTIEEVTERTFEDDGTEAEPNGEGPYREAVAKKAAPKKAKKKKPEAATTVAKPYRGCPAPDFVDAEIRARRVLDVFLSPDQRADFRKHNRFVTLGADTGFRYMLTSRHCNDELARFQRTLYDLDNRWPICTHDWEVPAAEELLSLHILLQLPGWESYLLGLDRLETGGAVAQLVGSEEPTMGMLTTVEVQTEDEERRALRTIARMAVQQTLTKHYNEPLDEDTRRTVNGFVCRTEDVRMEPE
jgi:hypothetical protein